MTETQQLLDKAEKAIDELATRKGDIVGVQDLVLERVRNKNQMHMAIAVMSIIAVIAVMVTVSLLRVPGPPGAPAPVPVSSQFVMDDSGCVYRVAYKGADGSLTNLDASAPQEACQ